MELGTDKSQYGGYITVKKEKNAVKLQKVIFQKSQKLLA